LRFWVRRRKPTTRWGTFSKEYVITISIPKSIIGKLVQTQVLDGHLAGIVYPNNMNDFNKAKVTMIIKVK
jgi:hypothetical protein